MRRLALVLVVLAGCTQEAPTKEAASAPTTAQPSSAPAEPLVTPAPTPTTTPPAPKVATRVELTAVTLADDCGGTPPWGAPSKLAKAAPARRDEEAQPSARSKAKRDIDDRANGARARRRCEQTSMQLGISAGNASRISVKSVELFDETGKSLGKLSASKPTRWSDTSAVYEAWDETLAAGSTNSVSYVLAQPRWDQIGDRWNRTFTLRTVLSVGGVDQTAQKDVTLSAPTTLPPNVRT